MRKASLILPLVVGLLCVLLLGFVTRYQFDFAAQNSPYEHWDEVTIYNNAGALMHHRQEGRAYAVYGMADTGKYLLARTWLENETGGPEPSFSNNRPQFWADPQQNAGAEFGYARGIPDRRGFLLARHINIAFSNLLAASIIGCLIVLRGKAAIAPIAGLLLVVTGAGCMEQSRSALPNTANAILAFGLMYFSLEAAVRKSRGWLAVSSALLAVGINHKFDFVGLGIIPAAVALSLLAPDLLRPKELLKTTAILLTAFVGGLLLSCPINTWVELKNQIDIVGHLTNSPASLDQNLGKALFWMRQAFTLKATAWQPDTVIPFTLFGGLLVISLVSPLVATHVPKWRRGAILSTIAVSLSISLIIPIIKANTFYGRYLINGISLVYAAAGFSLALHCGQDKGRRSFRTAAWLLSFVLVGLAGYRANLTRQYHIQHQGEYGPLSGNFTRNKAVAQAAELSKTNGFSGTILVDQHAYIDLRHLRQNGLDVIPINCATYESRLRDLPEGKHLVIFTTGSYTGHAAYAGQWDKPTRRNYESYVASLKDLPVVQDFLGKPMQLLDWRPPQPDDWMTLSYIERPPIQTP